LNPVATKAPHIPAKARAVIFLFMAGGPSHIETFDPKPLLNQLHGQSRPKEFGEVKYQFVQKGMPNSLARNALFESMVRAASRFRIFFRTWQSVLMISRIRSCHGDMVVHSAAQYELFTGRIVPGYPSMGCWVTYGLGSESESLPAYVVMPDPKGALEADNR
jgi:hypothetical protein